MTSFSTGIAQGSLALALLLASPSGAREVSFGEARAAAQTGAPEVLLAEHRSGVSNAEIDVAGALPNPTLGLTTALETARLGISLSVPLPIFGQRSTTIRAASADAEAVALDVGVVRREARWVATVAWIDLWEAQEHTRLLDLAAKDAERLLQVASERFDAGSGPRLDVVRTKADRFLALAEAEASRRAVAAAAARLAPWIGAEPEAELTAAGEPGYSMEELPLASLQGRLGQHPALKRDQALVLAAEAHLESEQRLRWPLITPQLTVNQFDPTLTGPDVIFGLSFDLPVLDLRGGAIARANEQRALAEATVSADERRLRAELLDAYRRTEAANAKLKALRGEVLPSMEEARNMTAEAYASGRVDLIRVIEAQKALLESRLAEAEALAAWVRAAADLEKASGLDFEGGAARAP